MTTIVDRIVAESGVPELLEVLADRLNPTDLQTLLLAVYDKRSEQRTPAQVVADYERGRFFGASSFGRSEFAAWEMAADEAVDGRFKVLTLSPMAPLASCAAVAPVGQAWSVPTARTGEVVSDPTNILAIEAALLRRKERGTVHLATNQRIGRPQAYSDSKMLAHFAMFALLSSGRDAGSFSTEADAIALHVGTHLAIFRALLGSDAPLSVSYTVAQRGESDARIEAISRAAHQNEAKIWQETDRPAAIGYYTGFCFHIWAERDGTRQQLSDGGTVDWVGKLIANGKERTVISGCGVEGVLARIRAP